MASILLLPFEQAPQSFHLGRELVGTVRLPLGAARLSCRAPLLSGGSSRFLTKQLRLLTFRQEGPTRLNVEKPEHESFGDHTKPQDLTGQAAVGLRGRLDV